MDPPALTRSQVARLLGVTTKTLYTWEKHGRFPAPDRDWRGWRRYGPEHVLRLRRLLNADSQGAAAADTNSRAGAPAGGSFPALDISARNRLRGTVVSVARGEVLSEVVMDLGHGIQIVSVVTQASVDRLDLRPGKSAVALIKATEVLLAVAGD